MRGEGGDAEGLRGWVSRLSIWWAGVREWLTMIAVVLGGVVR